MSIVYLSLFFMQEQIIKKSKFFGPKTMRETGVF